MAKHQVKRKSFKNKKTLAFNVSLHGRPIETVHHKNTGEKIKDQIAEVKRGLIHHDGFNPSIVVRHAR